MLLTVIWAGTTHYAARLLLDTDRRFRAYAEAHVWPYLRWAETWVPRVLGLAPFAIVLFASGRSVCNFPEIEDEGMISAIKRTLYIFDALVAVAGVAFLFYTVKRRDLMTTGLIQRWAESKLSIVNRLLQPLGLGGTGRRRCKGSIKRGPGARTVAPDHRVRALRDNHLRRCRWRRGMAATCALIVPVILGGWLPLLTFLSGLGRQFRAPLIVAAALVIALFSCGSRRQSLCPAHQRRCGAEKTRRPATAIRLNQALDLWMQKNDCAGKPSSCPRPIIIVGCRWCKPCGLFHRQCHRQIARSSGPPFITRPASGRCKDP